MKQPVQFEPLIQTYKQSLYAIFLRLTQREEEAALCVTAVFVKAAKQFSQHDGAISLNVWLYQIAIQHWRQQKQLERSPLYLKAGREQQLEQLIAHLPETARLIFLLRYGGACSYEEIAVILSMPVDQVMRIFDETKQTMRQEVREARR